MRSALLALKKKKYQQTLLDKTDQQLFNIEELVSSIEFASVQQKVFDALKAGTTVLQSTQPTLPTPISHCVCSPLSDCLLIVLCRDQ